MNPLDPLSRYLMMGKLIAILGAVAVICWQSSQIHKWHDQNDRCAQARIVDRTSYQNAQTAAKAKNDEQVQQAEQQQQRITDDAEKSYEADLARLRAERMRSQNATPASPSGKPGVSAPGATPGGPNAEAVPLPSDELLRAQETELQLNALIDWVLNQSKVDPNKQ